MIENSENSDPSELDFELTNNIAKQRGLKIASLNVNSLRKHIDEIRTMLGNYLFDVFAINESKIDSTILDSEINIPGYNIIRKDRNTHGGGVVIYIREHLCFTNRNDLVSKNLEMICIEINNPHCRSFLLSVWYRPPNSEISLFNEYELFLFKCDNENKELTLLGDLNCDVNKSPVDVYTSRLQFSSSLYQIVQLIDEPTRVTESSATTIDLILTNRPEYVSYSEIRDTKKSWSLINSLLGKKGKSTYISELNINNNSITDPKLIAEVLNDYFINIGLDLAADCPSHGESNDEPECILNENCNTTTRFCFSHIDIRSVLSTLKSLNVSKSTGIDNLPAKILKLSTDLIAPSLTYIFSSSLECGEFVDEWKKALVTPIYKSGVMKI